MRQPLEFKPVIWVGSSRRDLREFPAQVQKDIGDAIQQTQRGQKPSSVRTLSGFHGASVLEIREDHDGDTYRAVYTVRFAERLYVLHVFQKKSRHGIETGKQDLELIRSRLKKAEDLHLEWNASKQESD